MTRLDAILKGCSLLDDLFGFRKKEVRRKLEAAQDELEAALANLAKGIEILAETNAK